jgi:hypothetical protein
VEADRDPVGAKEDGDDREPGRVAAELGQEEVEEGAARTAEDGAAARHLPSQLRQSRPEDPGQRHQQDDRAAEQEQNQSGVVFEEAELDPERAADRDEEVEVEADVEGREEDLLDDQAGEDHRQGRAGEQRREHQQHHPGADVRRQEAVQRDRHRVAGEDQPVGDLGVGEGGAEDPEPGERRQRSLGRLRHHPGDHRPERDLADLVEEVADPLVGRDSEQVEHRDQQDHAPDPDRDPRQAATERVRLRP